MRDRRHLLIIPLAALFAVIPLILHGCSCGHDFTFHLHNWMEVASQWHQGIPYPHWSFTSAWNSGEPVFVFYPPISWALGALLGLFLPWSATPTVFTWITLTIAGLTMHRLAREFTTPTTALIAATAYLSNPYMLFTAYERTAYAELLAAAWLPLLLLAILRPKPTVPRIALPIALLWLTNAPAAVIGCYTAAFLTVLRIAFIYLKKQDLSPLRLALTTAVGTLSGLALAAFYILPAAYERRWVGLELANTGGMRIQDNTLFHRMGDPAHDAVLHLVSIIATILLTATAIFAIAALIRHKTKRLSTLLTITAGLIALLLTPLSLAIWRHAPQLPFLQFPWRFLTVTATLAALLLALALPKIPRTAAILAALLIPAALIQPAIKHFRQFCFSEDAVATRATLFRAGTGVEPTDYTPLQSDPEQLAHNAPPYWLSTDPQAPAPNAYIASDDAPPNPALLSHDTRPIHDRTHLHITAPTAGFAIINLRDYPAWRVQPATPHIRRDDGLLAIHVPAGPTEITLTYTHTADQLTSDAISILAAAALLTLRRRKHLAR